MMIDRIQRPAIVVAIVMAAGGIFAGGSSLRAAVAGGDGARPLSIVSCAKTTACQTYKNSNTGPALEGDNTNTTSTSAKAGLLGTSAGYAAGVEGLNTNNAPGSNQAGVVALSTGTADGVYANATGVGEGIAAKAASGNGVDGLSNSALGVGATSLTDIGLLAQTFTSSQPALEALGGSEAIYADSGSGVAGTISIDGSSTGIGVLTSTPPGGNAYPLVARDFPNNDNLFYVDGSGNVFYHGTLTHFFATGGGTVAQSYTPTAASPTIEDNGTAHLVNGVATVMLDPVFARSIDVHHAYQVMLTPDGDTGGLYTAVKTLTSFTVREVHGGHATIDFDYHIYAPSIGEAGIRIREMTNAQAVASGPRLVRVPRLVPHWPLRPHQ